MPAFNSIMRLTVPVLLAVATCSAFAQSKVPAGPIKIVVPYSAGGVTDVLGRMVARHLDETLGTTVIVENLTGAGGTLGSAAVATAKADGNTLLLGATGPISVGKELYPDLPYDPGRDFKPIAMIGLAPFIVVTNKEQRFKTIGELVAATKQDKAEPVTYGSAGNGTPQHIIGEMFKQATGAQLAHVPYRGSAPAIQDLLGNHIKLMFDNPVNLVGHIKSGRLIPLAQTGAKRLPVIADVPTLSEAGLTGFVATPWYGILAPAGIPADVAQRLNSEINSLLRKPDIVAKLAELGLESTPMSLEELDTFLGKEAIKWGEAARRSNASTK